MIVPILFSVMECSWNEAEHCFDDTTFLLDS